MRGKQTRAPASLPHAFTQRRILFPLAGADGSAPNFVGRSSLGARRSFTSVIAVNSGPGHFR